MDDKKTPLQSVKIDRLKIAFGKKVVINNFTLSMNAGDHLALLGVDGSGKSTLIHTLMGFIRPAGGLAQIAGFDCWKQSIDIRRCCGYVPAVPALDKDLSINDILNFSARLEGKPTDWDSVQSLVDRFHLDPRKRVASLSLMEVKFTAFILCFMTHPQIVLLDDPFLSLDDDGTDVLNVFLEEAFSEGQSLFAAISHPSQAGRVFKKIALLQEGELVSIVDSERLAGQIVRKVEVIFGAKPPLEQLVKSGMIRQLSWEGTTLRCCVVGPSGPFLNAINGYDVLDIKSREADLEETIRAVYLEGKDASS